MARGTEPGAAALLGSQRYAALRRDVEALSRAAQQVSHHAKVEAFHKLGRRIVGERLKLRIGYHNAVLRDLSLDTAISLRNLQYAVAFVAAYPRRPARGLSWAHYRVLLDRPDAASRARYEALARAEGLGAGELARRIRVESRAGMAEGDGPLPRPAHADYLYRAQVVQVVDGDTLELRVDLGFHVDRRGRFRLARVDCPELPSAVRASELGPEHPARAARDFVFGRLMAARTIVVHTERTDLHGRYVTHLFYSAAALGNAECFRQGTYLNAELIVAGHGQLAL